MKQSNLFLTTLHDPPSDAEVPSHRLLAQAGFIHKIAAGIYSYTPAMWRVLRKVSQIVREEMDSAGAQEVLLPALQPRSIWDESGRWDQYVNDNVLFCLKDRKEADMCLGPTHEEVVTTLVSRFVTSYKQLPVNLYQIQTKFRDEIRPRFGLMRGREFIMKDAYSFDINVEGMNESYLAMDKAYRRIFERCGLSFRVVDADSGAIGGSGSQEFIVTADTGEDLFILCDSTGYAANQEKAVSMIPTVSNPGESHKAKERVATPGIKTIEQLVVFFKGNSFSSDRFLKSVIYKVTYRDREELILALIRGDRNINEVKLKNKLDCLALALAADNEITRSLKTVPGFVGPVGLEQQVKIIADNSVRDMINFVTGANDEGYHFINVNLGRDLALVDSTYCDICLAEAGDIAVPRNATEQEIPAEQRLLYSTRGIEVGHIFKLGQKYSAAMKANFTDDHGGEIAFHMGCYGIGISRVAAAAIEQWHDEKGMIWPVEIAPWQVHLVCINPKNEDQKRLADQLYALLQRENIEVLYDDRPVSAGIKFNDADLIGLPLRVTIGRDATHGLVEFMQRKNRSDVKKIATDSVLNTIRQQL